MSIRPRQPESSRVALRQRVRFRWTAALVVGCAVVACTEANRRTPPSSLIAGRTAPIHRVCFGSCAKSLPLGSDLDAVAESQSIWNTIHTARPDVFMWTGDAVYADVEPSAGESLERLLDVQRQLYARLHRVEPYRRFAAAVPVIGTWDDHDYGKNNGGAEFPGKVESQKNYLDFLREPPDSPRRSRAGIYESYTCGPPGNRVKILLLDTRYHQSKRGPDGDLLGPEQWTWLEREITASDAQIHIIVSSIQVLLRSDFRGEQWYRWWASRERLFKLIDDSALSGTIFVTGDKHFGTIESSTDKDLQRPVFEIMSSGLTENSIIAGTSLAMARVWYGPAQVINERNFGVIEIDWDVTPVRVSLQIRDIHNKARLRTDLELNGNQLVVRSSDKTELRE